MEWISTIYFTDINKDRAPPFIRNESKSIIDITSATVPKKILNWKVLEEESLSLQKYIYYEVTTSKVSDQETSENKPGRILSKLDINKFTKDLNVTTHPKHHKDYLI